jgi:hypothetical protein
MGRLWSVQELEIAETLTRRVSLLSVDQIASIWWPDIGSNRDVRRKLRPLREALLIHRTFVNVHPRLTLQRPLIEWQPGMPSPDFTRVARRVKARWNKAAVPTEVYWGSQLAANLFGSSARQLPPLLHRDHDLLLGEVFVLYRRLHPQLATCWLSEHVFPKAGFRVKDPDAFIIGETGRSQRVIESAGRYGLSQIVSFHEHCVEWDLPYELW